MLAVVAVASFLALVFAGSGAAGTPVGVGCNFSDGQIDGQGATLQTRAQVAWIQGYTSDICGNSASTSTLSNGTTLNTMVIYNGLNTNSFSITTPNGSGNGLKANSCREVPYSGSDVPYTNGNLVNLDSTPGAQDGNVWFPSSPTHCTDFSGFANPFYGTANNYPDIVSDPSPDAAASDQQANMMSFPVTGTAVAVAVYWGNAVGCPTPTPQLTGQQLAQLYGGVIANWSDLGGAFANCKANGGVNPLPVTRVVRADNSGTTQNFLNYLAAVDGSTTADLCDNQTWNHYVGISPNGPTVSWPTTFASPHTACSTLTAGHVSGNPGVLDTCSGVNGQPTVPGSLCYADLPDLENGPYSVLKVVKLPPAVGGGFVSPFNGTRANCDFSGISTPGPSNDGAVGLAPGSGNPGTSAFDSWATDNDPNTAGTVVYHEAVANQGTGWPACAVTFDLVYSGSSQTAAVVSGGHQPNQQLTDDMRRTLYSYMLYVLTQGQNKLGSIFYQNLPQGLLNQEIAGFKANY